MNFLLKNFFVIYSQSGDEDYEVVPNSKFVVARTAFRDNSSYYSVDGKRKTYKEVATLLRASGIDLDHNRFLILQVNLNVIIFFIMYMLDDYLLFVLLFSLLLHLL